MLKTSLLRPSSDLPPILLRARKFVPLWTLEQAAPGLVAVQDRFMRYINKIIIHCTANRIPCKLAMSDFKRIALEAGHRTYSYHYYVFEDGTVREGQAISQPGTHCKGHNRTSIGVVYVGGLGADGRPCDTRTPQQKQALLKLVTKLILMYRCDVWGHRDLSPDKNHDGNVSPAEWVKDCPSFNAHEEYHPIYKQLVLGG